MPKNRFTTQDVADKLKVTPRRVLAIAKNRGIEPIETVGCSKLWSDGQVKRMRPGPTGNPNWRKKAKR